MRASALALSAAVLLLPVTSRADSLRCGSKIVAEGSSKVETLRKCGDPIARELRTELETLSVKEKDDGTEVKRERTVVRTIEQWTYNFGPNHFLQVVTFVDGRLRDVESGDYGF